MKKSQVNEALVGLYLRLNGYFTTGLVVHSNEWGSNRTEIDCLAIRLPNHRQPDTGIDSAPFLHLRRNCLDLLICEVKSSPKSLEFNEKLRDESEVLEYVLKWAGVLDSGDIQKVADSLRRILKDGFRGKLAHVGILEGHVRVRGLLACVSASKAEPCNGWCLLGSEILRYANECFNPPHRRLTCSTRYDLQLWGSWLGPIVEYFKGLKNGEEPSLNALYSYVKAV
jgi:hypothetical protein